jgi:hypothetical protein
MIYVIGYIVIAFIVAVITAFIFGKDAVYGVGICEALMGAIIGGCWVVTMPVAIFVAIVLLIVRAIESLQ